jgi:hypothetical protein
MGTSLLLIKIGLPWYIYISTNHKFSTVIRYVVEVLAIRTIPDIIFRDVLRIVGFISSLSGNSSKNKLCTKINLNIENTCTKSNLKRWDILKITKSYSISWYTRTNTQSRLQYMNEIENKIRKIKTAWKPKMLTKEDL